MRSQYASKQAVNSDPVKRIAQAGLGSECRNHQNEN
jgi:hypothetical protein